LRKKEQKDREMGWELLPQSAQKKHRLYFSLYEGIVSRCL
jgi:hypothetical protein